MPTTEEILLVIEKAKALGVSELEMAGIRVKFKEGYMETAQLNPLKSSPQPVPDMKAEQIMKPLSVLDEMSPEEVLYYATPHYDELQAQKKAHEEKLKQETPRRTRRKAQAPELKE